MAKMYYEKDCDLNYLNGKKIAVIGYGSQGHAHALNLKDSGCEVCVGLREGSKNWAQAEAAGLTVKTVAEAAKWGDIVMMLINDEVQADVYKKDMAPYLEDGAVAYVSRTPLREGDVGIFSVNGKVLCRQYDRDDSGTVHLFSLNRRRADGDVTLPAAEAGTLICFGRVLTGTLSNRN